MDERFGKWRNLLFCIIFALTCLLMQTFGENAVRSQDVEDSWCYYCISPSTNIVREKTRKDVIKTWTKQLKKLPTPENPECGRFTNLSSLPTQKCPSQYCFKHTTDDKDGTPFVIRMCTDQFVNFDRSVLQDACTTDQKEWTLSNCFCKGHLCNFSFKNFSSITTYIVFFVFLIMFYYFSYN